MTDLSTIAAGSADRFALWRAIASDRDVRTMAEVGVWRGAFAAAMLRDCPGIERYVMVDPWRNLDRWNKPYNVADPVFDTVMAEAMKVTGFAADRREVLRGTTREVIDRVPDGSLDLVYVDGDHTLRGITVDMVAWWPKVRPGGILGGDDLAANVWHHGLRFEPSFVFPFVINFAEAVGGRVTALGHNQFTIEKSADGSDIFSFTDLPGTYPDPSVLAQMRLRTLASALARTWLPASLRPVLRRMLRR
ncbi:MAG: class I SAM-dependent methyltransferase [Pseudomonadota bacterium]|nr:class I SAM-dependent methyltransferase [Pseudomonadota bacterium]